MMELITNRIFQLIVISFIISFPIVLFLLPEKIVVKFRSILPIFYIIIILFFTIIRRNNQTGREICLYPFKTYYKFGHTFVRWQIFMNIFLFIPLGFLIPFSSKRSFIQTLTIGLCLSITIEALQYIFALGLCETDDVIHNTLGCIIGYWYWFLIVKLRGRKHKERLKE